MKKFVLALLSIMICAATINVASARTTKTPALASAIKLYKAGNYSQSYTALNKIVETDPSNALAYYYLAMTCARIGHASDAVDNYSKVITLSPNSYLSKYAEKGRRCISTPDRCNEEETSNDTPLDTLIKRGYGTGFSEDAQSIHEREKIQNLRREINRTEEVPPQRFRDFKDFSAEAPTNDQIVEAIRVLQRAGMTDILNGNMYNSELSMLGASSNRTGYDLWGALMGKGNSAENISPELIQSLLTSQMNSF